MSVDLRDVLDQLAARAATGDVGRAQRWRGADVVIGESQPEVASHGFYPEPRFVITAYPGELSWLFEQLCDAFSGRIDGCTKIEFFGRLANAVVRYHSQYDDEESLPVLLAAVLHEAYAMAEEMDAGTFASYGIGFGNEIVDDYIDPGDRHGFVSIGDTKRFLATRGIEL